jgi:hypothetical protein
MFVNLIAMLFATISTSLLLDFIGLHSHKETPFLTAWQYNIIINVVICYLQQLLLVYYLRSTELYGAPLTQWNTLAYFAVIKYCCIERHDIQHNDTQHKKSLKWHSAKQHSVFMLNVIMLSVVMLNVVTPSKDCGMALTTFSIRLLLLNSGTIVRDVRLVIIRNVFGTCADKTDADRRINIINLMLKSHWLIPHYLATCISLMAHFMTDATSPFLLHAASHTLSLSVSPLSCSLPSISVWYKNAVRWFWVINE